MRQTLHNLVEPSKESAPVPQNGNRLESIFRPKSVAVIGASNREGSVGNAIFKNMLLGSYCGTLYPVNPNYTSICGVHAYPNVTAIPADIHLAVIIVPASCVSQVVGECGRQGVHGAV